MEKKSWINRTLALATFAALLHLVGFIAPMWIWLDQSSFTIGVGLWFSTGCGVGGTCGNVATPSLSFGYSSDDTSAKPEFKAVQALQTLGVVGEILLLILLILYRKGCSRWTKIDQLNLATFIASVFTWLCILTGVMVYCADYWPVVGTSPLLSSSSFPWSLLFCLIAVTIFIIVSVLIRLKCQNTGYVKHAIPLSGDAQMDLYPVTKYGLLHRYFNQTYHDSGRPSFALTYHNEGTNLTGIKQHLIGSGHLHGDGASIDNNAFNEGSHLEGGVNYRYLPPPNKSGVRSITQTVMQRPIPNVALSPPDTYHANRVNQASNTITALESYSAGPIDPVIESHVTESRAGRREVLYPPTSRRTDFQSGGVPLDFPNYSLVTSRDIGYGQGAQSLVCPVIPMSTSYTAGVTQAGRGDILADNTTDSRFTGEGRLTADAEYLAIPKTRRGNSRALSETGSAASGSALQLTTHLGPVQQQTSSLLPLGVKTRFYQPSFNFRLFHEQIY